MNQTNDLLIGIAAGIGIVIFFLAVSAIGFYFMQREVRRYVEQMNTNR